MNNIFENEKLLELFNKFLASDEVQELINELDPFFEISNILENLDYQPVEGSSNEIVYERDKDGLTVMKITYEDNKYTAQYLFAKSTENSKQIVNKAFFNLTKSEVINIIEHVENL